MIQLTPNAVSKIKEIMGQQNPIPMWIRIGVRGGGCSGFQYAMAFENEKQAMDKEFDFDGLKVIIDPTSLLYLDGCMVDYLETLEASGFKFENPNVKNTCGCGQSFNT